MLALYIFVETRDKSTDSANNVNTSCSTKTASWSGWEGGAKKAKRI